MMEVRNAAFNRHGTIDCEIEHPLHGWIHFTASPDDPEERGRNIHAEAVKGEVAEYVKPEIVVIIPNRVSRRQFRMQLAISGLKDMVETWVATQNDLVQISYIDSDSFVRDEPMMQAGFAALGFTEEQGDAFFLAASAI